MRQHRLTVLAALSVSTTACATRVDPRPMPVNAEQEVRRALSDWNATLARGDTLALPRFYVAGSGLRWYEDGTLRYTERGQIVEAYRSFPKGTSVVTALREIAVTPLDANRVHVEAGFQTRILMPADTVGFSGVFTAVMQRSTHGWEFTLGHSSSTRPSGR